MFQGDLFGHKMILSGKYKAFYGFKSFVFDLITLCAQSAEEEDVKPIIPI